MQGIPRSIYFTAFRYASIVAIGGFVFGLDAAAISGTVRFITAEFNLSDLQVGAVVSAPGFGVIFALLAAGYFADKYGRKETLQWIAALYLVSALLSALAPNYISLLVARFIGGLAFTSLSLASMYIGEIAPSHLRGKLVSMNQIMIVVGLSAAYFINYLILQASNSGAEWVTTLGIVSHTWRWMLGVEIVPASIWFMLLFTIPRSPRWLVMSSRLGEAKQVLSKIMPAEEVIREIDRIQESAKDVKKDTALSEQLKQLFDPKMRKAFLIGLTIVIVQPITGINAILFYAPTVFEQVGIGTDAAFVQAVLVGICGVVFTVLALLLIDRLGRRPITLWGLLWAVVSLAIVAHGFNQATYVLTPESLQSLAAVLDISGLESLVGIEYSSDIEFKKALTQALGDASARTHASELIQSAADIPSTLVLFGIMSFICAFNFSIGPIMWVLLSEIFPIQVRGIAIPAFALVTSMVSYLVQQFFPWQLATMGARDIFLFYAITSAVGLLILFRLLPETKNKTIEEIELALKG